MKLLITLIFCLTNFLVFSQDCKLVKSKALSQRFSDASSLMKNNKELGIRYLVDIANNFPAYYPATFLVGQYYLEKAKDAQIRFRQKDAADYANSAINYLNLSYSTCDLYDSVRAAFLLGEANFMNRNFENASKFYQVFLDSKYSANSCKALANRRMEMIDDYFDIINNPVSFNPKILKNVSTKNDEYLPLISLDGSILLYTQRSQKSTSNFVEELMISTLQEFGDDGEVFSPGSRLPKPFNAGKLQGGASLSIDNRIMYITICNYDNCDIYYSKNVDGVWQNLIKMPNTVNTEYFDGQPSVDATGNVLYFSSNRPGGYGGYDLYKIVRQHPDSLWSAPINLGPNINTEFDEKTPYIHCDGRTLYFSSNGHGGVGGFDIFFSRLQNLNTFSKPQNIGYPMNTENDEVAYVVSADGKRIYFSSKLVSGEGGWDIYCSDLYDGAGPNQVLLIKGTVTDDDGNPIPDVSVDLTGLTSFETSHSVTDPKSGEYAVSTPVDKDEDYMLTVKKKGFFYNVKIFQPDSGNYVPPTIDNLKLQKIKTGVPYTLENVNFAYNSARLTEISKAYLHQLALFLEEYPQFNAEIRGHTDGTGSDEENLILSERRCKTVVNYLVTYGIDVKRLSFKGFGKSAPLTSNSTSEGRAINRRVEVVLSPNGK